MSIDVVEKDGIELSRPVKEWVRNAAKAVLEEERLPDSAEAAVYIADDLELMRINQKYRGIGDTTDVLSFPANALEKPLRDAICDGYQPEYDMDSMILGDIAVSFERAEKQARKFAHSLEREISFLVIHGMLHLLGYGHKNERDEYIMRNKQRAVLRRLGI